MYNNCIQRAYAHYLIRAEQLYIRLVYFAYNFKIITIYIQTQIYLTPYNITYNFFLIDLIIYVFNIIIFLIKI